MAHWRERFKETDKFIGAVDLWDDQKKAFNSVVVTIERFREDTLVGSMGKEKKPYVKLKEFSKPMVMNKTNYGRLSKFFGTPDENAYVGKQIVLTVEKTRDPNGGGETDGLRFSTRPIPQPTQQSLQQMSAEEFEKAKANVASGKTTVEKIEKLRSLTAEQKEELLNVTPK